MWHDIVQALCLVLIIEGMIPFLYPSRWRKFVNALSVVGDKQLRVMGLMSMLFGVLILFLIK